MGLSTVKEFQFLINPLKKLRVEGSGKDLDGTVVSINEFHQP